VNNFWQKLKIECGREKRPILALAPMAGVTDSAFRQMCKEFGADVVYSEMASVNALAYAPQKTLEMLSFEESERPYIIQLFGSDPKFFQTAVQFLIDEKIENKKNGLNFFPNGFDINFGCPVPKVAKQKAGAELAKDLKKSRKVIEAVVKSSNIPVSIKIRKKAGEIDALRFLDNISDLNVAAVMIHGRELKQMHSGPVDASIIKNARNYFGGIILANGGVKDYESGTRLWLESEADGIGIGQGALGRPWIFEEIKNHTLQRKNDNEKLSIALRHARLAHRLKSDQGVIEMRKHLCWYIQGMSGARQVREEFVRVEKIEDIERIIHQINDKN